MKELRDPYRGKVVSQRGFYNIALKKRFHLLMKFFRKSDFIIEEKCEDEVHIVMNITFLNLRIKGGPKTLFSYLEGPT